MSGGLTRYRAYVDSLPDGIDSYPDCQQKASLYRGFLEQVPLDRVKDELPAPLRALVERPVDDSGWISEVHGVALWLAACDLVMRDEQELADAVARMNEIVLNRPLARILLTVASPRILFSAIGGRWAAFHRGSQLTSRTEPPWRLTLTYPHGLFPESIAAIYARVCEVAWKIATRRPGRFVLTAWRATTCRFEHVDDESSTAEPAP